MKQIIAMPLIRRRSRFFAAVLTTLALLTPLAGHAAAAPSSVSPLLAEVQAVQDSLTALLPEAKGLARAELAYQLGIWTRDAQYAGVTPWNDRCEAMFDLAMIKRGRFDLAFQDTPPQGSDDDHITGPHWTKALRDVRRYEVQEAFDEMRDSYLYLWPALLPEVRLLAEGDIVARQHQLDSALVLYKQAFDSASAPLLKGEIVLEAADVYFRKNDFDTAYDTLRWALHHGAFGDQALYQLGRTLIRLGRTRDAIDMMQAAVAVNPYHEQAHYFLGNGYTPLNYTQIAERYPEIYRENEAAEHLPGARELLKENKLDSARTALEMIASYHPNLIEPQILLAEIAWLDQEYDIAEAHCDSALALCPEYGRAHAILARVQEGRRLHLSARRAQLKATFDATEMPDVPGIDKYVVNWAELTPRHQKRVALSIAPWKSFVPVLVATGQTHYIKPLHEILSQAPGMEDLRDQRIDLDSRLWDDVRGAGGYHTVTGIEDVERLIYGGYNTVVHELTHQVHGLLTEPEKRQLEEAYRAAKAREAQGTKTFMSRYQGSTVWEYFAEGVNAWVTPPIDEYDEREMRHDRLVAMDTTLATLVQHFLSVTDVTPYYTVGYVSAAYQALSDGQADTAWARLSAIDSTEADVRNVLMARSFIASLLDRDDDAISYALRYTELYPLEPDGWMQLANAHDYAADWKDFDAIHLFREALAQDSLKDRHTLEVGLGYRYWRNGHQGAALARFDSALAVQGDLPDALWMRAMAQADSARETRDCTLFARAVAGYDTLMRLRGGSTGLRMEYARALLQWGDLEGAGAQIEEAVTLEPNDPGPKSMRAWLAMARGDTATADSLLGVALAMHPVPDLTRVLASAFGLEGQPTPDSLRAAFAAAPPRYVYNPRHFGYTTVNEWLPWYGELLGTAETEAPDSTVGE